MEATPPGLKIFRANSVVRASASCSKFLNDKKYFNPVKNFRKNSVFRTSASFSKILNDKNMHSVSAFKAHSVFQDKRKLLKNPECKKYIQYSENFQGKHKLLKNPE